jgi:hypothetical protein
MVSPDTTFTSDSAVRVVYVSAATLGSRIAITGFTYVKVLRSSNLTTSSRCLYQLF